MQVAHANVRSICIAGSRKISEHLTSLRAYSYTKQNSKMSNLSDYETPLLRVSRPVSACSKCRSAKIRCDGKLPACTACEKNGRGHECSSANDQFARGKERSYVASLESRVEKLERKIMQARSQQRSGALVNFEMPAPTLLPVAPTNPKNQKQEAAVVDDLVSDFGFL